VRYFFERLQQREATVKHHNGIQLFAVGEKTKKEIERFGWAVAALPETFNAESLLEAMDTTAIAGKHFLIPHGNLGREILPETLRHCGAEVDVVTAYQTLKPSTSDIVHLEQLLLKKEIDVITFFSPSSVKNFLDSVPYFIQEDCLIAVIGPTTAQAIEEHGLRVDVIAEQATAESLVMSIAQKFEQ
jgi:uroporphyrinogen III methyltransferase/synthase